jgi:hypothetical protein
MPALTAHIDLDSWDSRATLLGGASNSLAAALACRLAVRVGRVRADGTVLLRFLASLRTPGDTRANAHTSVDVVVDPTTVTTCLNELQTSTTKAILAAMDRSNDRFHDPLPLAAMTPKRLLRKLANSPKHRSALPVMCSNLGDLPRVAYRADGHEADSLRIRGLWPGMTRSMLESIGGQLFVATGRTRGRIFVRVSAYLPGGPNTATDLREIVEAALREFGLEAEFDC